MYFWGNDFETLCEKNCRQYRVYADIYPKNDSGGYDGSPYVTYTATRGSADAGAISFETAAIVSVKIVRGITSGAFSYGGAFGGQLTLVTTADTKIPADDTKIVISVSFVSEEGAETGKAILGTFFSETVASGQFTKTIKAVDGISKLTKYYVPNPEEFPMTAMELFKKAAVAAGVDPALSETDFKLNNPNITEAPFKKKEDLEERENSDQAEDEYYTYREIAGMIASINAGNAFVSALNHLNISTPDTNLKREIPIKSVISYTDNEVVNQFTTTFWAQTYEGEGTPPEIDPLSENYNPSVMVVDFPLKTDSDYATMQTNIDSRIGGISYNGIVIKKQGTGRQEIGDLLAFNDTYRNKKFNNVLVMGIVYDISANNGFTETLYSLSQSEAKQQAKGISTNDRINKVEKKADKKTEDSPDTPVDPDKPQETSEKIIFKRGETVYGAAGIHDIDGVAGIALSMDAASGWIGLLDGSGNKILEYANVNNDSDVLEPAHQVSGDLWVLPCRAVSDDGTESDCDIYYQYPFKDHRYYDLNDEFKVSDVSEYGDPNFAQCSIFTNIVSAYWKWGGNPWRLNNYKISKFRIKDTIVNMQFVSSSADSLQVHVTRPDDSSSHAIAEFFSLQQQGGIMGGGTLFVKTSNAEICGSSFYAPGNEAESKLRLRKIKYTIPDDEESKDFYQWLFDDRYIYNPPAKAIKIYKDIILMNGAKIYNEDGTEYKTQS